MIKKIIKNIFFVKIIITIFFLFFNTTFWQNIWDIQAKFCETYPNNNEMNIITQANQETDICLIFENQWNSQITIQTDFVDWATTNQWTKWCMASHPLNKKNFWQFVESWNQIITFSPKEKVEKIFTIKYPIWYSWFSHWCLTYNLYDWTWKKDMIFRKVHNIDILVWWTEVKSKIDINYIKIEKDQVSNRLSFIISNDWNIDQTIDISWFIYNKLWYKEKFEIKETAIKSQETLEIKSKKLNLPEYKWAFKLSAILKHKPIFNFNITNSNLKTKYSNPWKIIIEKTLTTISWFYTISIWIIIILSTYIIINIFKRKSPKKNIKKHK